MSPKIFQKIWTRSISVYSKVILMKIFLFCLEITFEYYLVVYFSIEMLYKNLNFEFFALWVTAFIRKQQNELSITFIICYSFNCLSSSEKKFNFKCNCFNYFVDIIISIKDILWLLLPMKIINDIWLHFNRFSASTVFWCFIQKPNMYFSKF